MKKTILCAGMICFGLVYLLSLPAYPQEGKGAVLQKQGQTEVAADSDQYVIGPEDILYIHVWKEESFSRTVPVRMDGKISLPLIDEIQAAGLTPLKLREVLVQKLKEFIDGPNVSVMVVEANSFKVFVSGEVRTPGVFRLKSETSLLQLIPMAGGFTDWADQKRILINKFAWGLSNEEGSTDLFGDIIKIMESQI